MSHPKKRFYIIRHGETDLNKNGIVQGRGINSELNDKGKSQGAAFFEKYKDLPFDKVYTSSLVRTHQTVAKFIEKGIPWEQLSGLDELAWGKYEGLKSTPELRIGFKKLIENWSLGRYDEKVEGGESPNEVFVRQVAAMKHILAQENENLVLMCMHGRAMRLLMCQLLKKSMDKMDDYPHQNTSLYILDYDGVNFEMQTFNSLVHLQNL
ncbi:MAG: histidine phosphatase family protein [Bacteroidetes bacterium]|nr:histidine phosphatase family protein [Bacteroidota bacterium]MBU1372571.1 histidine phosphatase family protein [Bacteroidota bacterium]MBU1485020.1 histidine phosphatase family protein [Bacteroidota bacterium]MBU1759894.1 histidine phosphatase family protein [Bacteroidota bacterium]MBU2269307.1 histidine phosphatase family protein [Bacteroidota bacterium]